MKKLAILFIAITIVLAGCSEKKNNGGTEAKINWMSYQEGMNESNSTGKPAILYFYSNLSDLKIFSDNDIAQKSKDFVMIRVETDNKNKSIAGVYNITKSPVIIFIKNGTEVMRVNSLDKTKIISEMDNITASQNNEIAWLGYSEGMEKANSTGKPILLYLCTPKNQICKYTDDTIFSNNEIIKKSKDFVMIKIDVNNKQNTNIIYKYRLQYIPYLPTIIFIYHGEILHRLIAYDVYNPNSAQQSIEDFKNNMDKALQGEIWGRDFSFITLDDGRTKHLHDYHSKVVLLDLMATWCQPCRMQMNQLESTLNHYGKNDGVAIISLDVEPKDDANKIKATFSSHINEWTFGMDKYGVAQKYLLQNSIPTLVIFDKHGRLSYLHAGLTSSQQLISIIDEIK
ncbi:MAG: thioredoxin family protein [Thermoplasmata archaeon]|nr:thioredoxin family protein [Thermoplasmata archaeon]